MSDNPKQAFFQSANSSTSTLRPRQNRLISFLDDEDLSASELQESHQDGTGHSRTAASEASVARSNLNASNRKAGRQPYPHLASEIHQGIPNIGLWNSWPSISGIASSLIGGETPSQVKGKGGRTTKATAWQKTSNTFTTRKVLPEWGTSVKNTQHMTASALEERQAMVQAKRREALLRADVHERPDLNGRYKRRDSGTDFSSTISPMDMNQDALAYVHYIQPKDTLAGVVIKYSCQPEAFRKINRLWPNDNIQIREHVLVPVDACTARGKKIENISVNLDLLGSDLENSSFKRETSSDPNAESSPFQSSTIAYPPSLTTFSDASDYQHESWVQLPQFSLPTEILRIPRRTLGYFPPARRKSGQTSPQDSTTSTPKSSFDMLRHPPTHAASLNASPVRRPRIQGTRERSSSTATGNISFADHLKGPGGVGTLRGLRMEAARPGPADDPLNRKFKEYLPNLNLAPPEDFPRASLTRSTPRASTDSIRSTSSTGLVEVRGAIEGWVRKLGGGKATRGTTGGRMGDLIELDTHSDSGMGEAGEADEDGEQTPTLKTGGTSATEEALLNEQFPVRGRIRNTYIGKDKGD